MATTTKSFPPPPVSKPATAGAVQFGKIQTAPGHRFTIYGSGGIGKTTLACMSPGPVAFFDLDDSLSRLLPGLKAQDLDKNIMPVEVTSFKGIRDALHAPGWDSIKTIVIDTLTKAEELIYVEVLATIPHEKGHFVKRMEDYGWGKGFHHAYEVFLPLLADLDAHCRAGRNVILICHDCIKTVPNPAGDDWLRFEPRLQDPTSGKGSIRLRIKEWTDHLLFFGYDVNVSKDGKGKGGGSRTIYPSELPHCMAKSRTISYPIANPTAEMWQNVLKGDV